MPKPQKRDNEYYERRLKDEHLGHYADFLAGKYKSARAAHLAAGVRTKRTRLHELKNAWGKATNAEKREFLRWLRQPTGKSAPPSGSALKGMPRPVAVDRRLQPWAIKKLQVIMKRHGLKPGDLCDELGLSRQDQSVAGAIRRGNRIKLDVIQKIEKWLAAH